MPSNHWWPEVRCEKTVAPATTNVQRKRRGSALFCAVQEMLLAMPKCVYLPTDFSADPVFSIPEPVPLAAFLPVHLIPLPVALRPLKVALPVAEPVLTTAVLAAPPAVLMSSP